MPKISDLTEVFSLVDSDEFLILDGDQNRRITAENVFGSTVADYQTRAAAVAATLPNQRWLAAAKRCVDFLGVLMLFSVT